MKWLKRIAIALAALALVVAAAPYFLALGRLVPAIEQAASERLKEPVRIASLRAGLLPLPHVSFSGVKIGRGEEVALGRVTVSLDLWSLLSATKVIRSIEIEDLVLTQKGIEKIPVWTRADAGAKSGAVAVRVEAIRLERTLVRFGESAFGPFDARVALGAGGEPEEALITTRDGKLRATIRPERSGYRIDASARQWRSPLGPALHFDELALRGTATLKEATLSEIRARLYGGSVAGRASLGWERGVRLKGSAEVRQIEIRPLLAALGRAQSLSGRLDAKPVFSAAAASAAQLAEALRLETPFKVRDGVLYGMDIGKTAGSLLGKEGARGGETRFDELSGHFALERGTRRFTRLRIASGALSAEGTVTISPGDELSGRITAKLKAGTLASASVPLNVAGTVGSPLLLPTGATVAGAAVGTAILGPGLGTSVGSSIGSAIGRFFGDEEKK